MSQIDAQQRIAELSRVVTMETIHAQRRHPNFFAALYLLMQDTAAAVMPQLGLGDGVSKPPPEADVAAGAGREEGP